MQNDKPSTRWAWELDNVVPPPAVLTATEHEALMREPPGTITYMPHKNSGYWWVATLFLVISNMLAAVLGFILGYSAGTLWRFIGHGG